MEIAREIKRELMWFLGVRETKGITGDLKGRNGRTHELGHIAGFAQSKPTNVTPLKTQLAMAFQKDPPLEMVFCRCYQCKHFFHPMHECPNKTTIRVLIVSEDGEVSKMMEKVNPADSAVVEADQK